MEEQDTRLGLENELLFWFAHIIYPFCGITLTLLRLWRNHQVWGARPLTMGLVPIWHMIQASQSEALLSIFYMDAQRDTHFVGVATPAGYETGRGTDNSWAEKGRNGEKEFGHYASPWIQPHLRTDYLSAMWANRQSLSLPFPNLEDSAIYNNCPKS